MKTVLITGGAKRLGRALVEHYAALGWRVLFTASASQAEAAELAAKLGPNVCFLKTRVSNQANAILIAKWVRTYTDKVDLLVCNASSFKRESVEHTDEVLMQDMLESNFLGPYYLIQQCLPMLKEAGGCVVTMGDAQIGAGKPHFSAYLASKAALVSMTKSLALELAPAVRVNTVLPGFMEWPESGEMIPVATQEAIVKRIPLKRTGTWEDLVGAIDFLQRSSYVTGSALTVDGGRASVY